jgi:hypothetical protein
MNTGNRAKIECRRLTRGGSVEPARLQLPVRAQQEGRPRANIRIGLLLLLMTTAMSGPAMGQISLVGDWSPKFHEDHPERMVPGPALGDYLGLPVTDGARMAADSWDASRLTLREHQCKVHTSAYIYRGPPLQVRIWEEKDPNTQQVIAIKNYISLYEQTRTIWMDGRPHPPEYGPHTWMGFSTGKWAGDILTVATTHLKQEWIRRNGIPNSELATMIEHFIRHDDVLTHVSILTDPVYLTEPLIKSEEFGLNERPTGNWTYACEYVDEVANRPKGTVPHYLPGQNPFSAEFTTESGIPLEATRGGAETMYPEYVLKLKSLPPPVVHVQVQLILNAAAQRASACVGAAVAEPVRGP